MSLVAAAVCPHPPMIVGEIATGAAHELDDLRAACATAVKRLAGCGAQTLVVLGGAATTLEYRPPFRGSFRPWGVPLDVTLGHTPAQQASAQPVLAQPAPAQPGSGRPGSGGSLPLSLLTGAWLLRGTTTSLDAVTYRMVAVAEDLRTADCLALAGTVAASVPWALLVMGDGSACRGPKAPGYDDPRAEPYDHAVAGALAGADAEALLGLDPTLSAHLKVAGRAPWQVLAGAVRAAGGAWRGELGYAAAPYGVGYFVANWERV